MNTDIDTQHRVPPDESSRVWLRGSMCVPVPPDQSLPHDGPTAMRYGDDDPGAMLEWSCGDMGAAGVRG
ncbi:hypothetical protein GCM10009868_39150 [Terrabacter aerolatus]|uniref:Uncharacterized protein n=1 Tax=Terrabacter aerolatus TaxID=422442 RepID=A0A512D0G0_9MICO|nr:hypothetical protein TAE01_17620 [Terrabacter aerolatus]